jgi:GntR family transcriptional regulator
MINFYLEPRSGVSVYMQLVHQVRDAVRFGRLRPGDQLPTAREVVERLAINPNTVLKAYRELERDGLVRSRPGLGTFVTSSGPQPVPAEVQLRLRRELRRWLGEARVAGLDPEAVLSMVGRELQEAEAEGIA